MGKQLQIFLWIILLASTAGAQLTIPALDVTNKGADTTFVRRTSVRTDSLFGHLYGDADSLGGNPWTSYLRSDVADTVNGQLSFTDNISYTDDPNGVVQYILGVGAGLKLEFGMAVPQATNATNATNANNLLYGATYQPGTAFLRSNARDTATASIIFNTGGRLAMYSDSAQQASIEITLRDDSAKGIRLTLGNQVPSGEASLLFITGSNQAHAEGAYCDLTRYGELGRNTHGQGFYIGNNSWGTYYDITDTAIGAYYESNFATKTGSRGAYFIHDHFNGGRGISAEFYDQGSAGTWPQIIFTRDGLADTNRIYQSYIDFDSIGARKQIKLLGSDSMTISNSGDTTIFNTTAGLIVSNKPIKATGGFIADSTTAIFKFWFKRNDTTFAVVGTDTLYWPKKP